MKYATTLAALLSAGLLFAASFCSAGEITPEVQAKIDAKVQAIQAWGKDSTVIAAVKEYNSNPSADAKAMDNDKWKSLNIMDPLIRSLAKNSAMEYLKSQKDDSMTELFVSGADGGKVGFLAKTTSWSHKGKPKHDVPMTGKNWQGKMEVDESTGKESVQVSVPVVDGETAIGSIVVGLSATKL